MATPKDFQYDALIGGAVMSPGTLVADRSAIGTTPQALTTISPDASPETKKYGTVDASAAQGYIDELAKKREANANQSLTRVDNAQNASGQDYLLQTQQPQPGPTPYFDVGKAAKASFDPQKTKIEEQAALEKTKLTEQQTEATGSQNVAAFRFGQTNTPYAAAALTKLNTDFQRKQDELERSKQELLNRAWDMALSGQIGASQKIQRDIAEIDMAKAEDATKQAKLGKEIIEIQKADSQEGGAIYSLVQAGREPTQTQLEGIDLMRGYRPGTSAMLYQAEKATFDREQTKEERTAYASELNIQKSLEELADKPMDRQAKMLDIQAKLQASKDAMYTTISKIHDAVKGALPGQIIPIGNAEYFNLPGVQQGFIEKDANGMGRIAGFDAKGQLRTQSLGYIGDPADLESVYVNGLNQIQNKRTGQVIPITNGVAGAPLDTGWAELCPPGSAGGQCGTFIHKFIENYPYGVNTVEQRKGIVNVQKTETPKVGDVLLQDYGTTGHSAMVSLVFDGPKGKMVRLTESNYGKDGLVSNSRTVPVNDPSILGYFRGQLRPQAETGSGLPPVSGPVLPSQQTTPAALTNPFIVPGVKMTASQMQEAQQKFAEAKRGAQRLLAGKSKDDVPLSVRTEAMDLASKQGWIEPLSKEELKTQKEEEKTKSQEVEKIDALKNKVQLVDDLLVSKGMAGSVGPYFFSRWTPFTMDKEERQDFAAGVNQLISKETIDTLLSLKERGGTLGALSDSERFMLQSAASKIGSWMQKDDNGVPTGKFVAGEKSFKKELNSMRSLALKAIEKAGGATESASGVIVDTPSGQISFPDQASADSFKKANNL